MAYTTINKSTDYFNTKLYTGNGSSQSFTGVGFQPDFTWIKRRGSAEGHSLFDVIRGVQKRFVTNDDGGEATISTSLTAFGSDGFTLGGNDTVNGSSTYASWNWKANGAGSANTDGTTNSTVSVNTTAGFSIVTYTGNSGGSGYSATIGHGLGVAPEMIIVKSKTGSRDWFVYHKNLGATKYLRINSTDSVATHSSIWYNTAPTSSVFTVGTNTGTNGTGENYIAYCFAPKTGYSKFGSYVGNGNANGSFIFCGFKPAFVMYKKAIETSGNTARWTIIDNKRDIDNVASHGLFPNATSAENTGSGYWDIDMLSNGFKMRTTEQETNESGSTFIYMAFAEAPLVGTNNTPCTAR